LSSRKPGRDSCASAAAPHASATIAAASRARPRLNARHPSRRPSLLRLSGGISIVTVLLLEQPLIEGLELRSAPLGHELALDDGRMSASAGGTGATRSLTRTRCRP